MCAIVLYRKRIRGRLYPKAARTGPYAFAQEVRRVNGKVVTTYLGIREVTNEVNVTEIREEESHDHQPSETEEVQQKLF